jgi:hypothetical protein
MASSGGMTLDVLGAAAGQSTSPLTPAGRSWASGSWLSQPGSRRGSPGGQPHQSRPPLARRRAVRRRPRAAAGAGRAAARSGRVPAGTAGTPVAGPAALRYRRNRPDRRGQRGEPGCLLPAARPRDRPLQLPNAPTGGSGQLRPVELTISMGTLLAGRGAGLYSAGCPGRWLRSGTRCELAIRAAWAGAAERKPSRAGHPPQQHLRAAVGGRWQASPG